MWKYADTRKIGKGDSKSRIRYIVGPVNEVALAGLNRELLMQINKDKLKLAGGSLGGGLLGAFLSGGIAHATGASDVAHVAAALGSLGGSLLGNYLTFKTIAKNRDLDVRFF